MQKKTQPVARRLPAFPDRQYARLLRYGCAGLAGTAVHYAVMFTLLDPVAAVTASTIGAVAGGLANFWLARRWVFSARRHLNLPLAKFAVTAIVVLGVNAAILSLLITALPVLPSQLGATACAFLVGYVVNDTWSFREHLD